MMDLTAFTAIVTFVAFPSLVNCSEILELNKHIRPFLLNQHPIFVTHGNVPLPGKNFQTLHAEGISSVLVYNFEKEQITPAESVQVIRTEEVCNVTGTYYSRLMWRRLPSFIHILPNNLSTQVYSCQYLFLLKSGLGFKTRPRINSVIITLENSTIHQKDDAELYRNLHMKEFSQSVLQRSIQMLMLVETIVDYYDFALHLKPASTKLLSFEPIMISSASVLKLCFGGTVFSKISLFRFERCEKSPLNLQDVNYNCVNTLLQIVSETNLNLSRFGIELETRDTESGELYGNCLTPKTFKDDFELSFSSNYKNIYIQNVLLQELFRGLPVLNNCNKESYKYFIVINVRFSPQSNTYVYVRYEFQASGSFQTQEAFNFLTCDGVRKKTDFMAYVEPFDASTWCGTAISLACYSIGIAILIFRTQNTSFVDVCVSSLVMNFSFLTGISNTSVKLLINNHLNAIRILMLFWSIATFILCIAYSSLVTSNVIAPSAVVSPWTNYKQLEKFTKVFGLNNQEMLRMDRISKHSKSDRIYRLYYPRGSKVSMSWFVDMRTQLLAKYNPTEECDFVFNKSSTCQTFMKKLYEFLDSYRYAVRSNVENLKKVLSVCTNTAYVDTETSIDHVLHILCQDKSVPTMVKGSLFFQQSHYWTMSDTWLLRKLMNSRMKALTTSGIIAFWEKFCYKYCKKRTGHSAIHPPVMSSEDRSFQSQELESNLTSLFFLILIMSAISILCFVGELCITFKTILDLREFVKIAGVSFTKKCLILISECIQRTLN
jgi:hypothetical protein